ncbi:uncharacterized protein TRAVEDRAFT_133000, partial [Trametes versicolor FP-101664 SS1]|uniref:uncharacterized protein n=1 Tax=Trametes versicolor (strain FP-101664) TaxID=717944 RepID=UPI00046236E4
MKAAKKYGVACETTNPSAAIRAQLPVWYHVGRSEGRISENSKSCKCLRDAHQVRTVSQCAEVATRLDSEEHEHRPHRGCQCEHCRRDRDLYGCDNPHRCASAAALILSRLTSKWSLTREDNNDGLTLTPRRKRANETARIENDRILFDPTIATPEPLMEAMRVFVPNAPEDQRPALRPMPPFQVRREEVEIFTDGSAVGNGSGNARAGSGIWFGDGDARNEGARVPYDPQTNQVAEMYAVEMAHRRTPPHAPMHIVSD